MIGKQVAWVMGVMCLVAVGGPAAGDEGDTPRPDGGDTPTTAKAPFLSMNVKDIDGKDVSLSKYAGDVCLVVNVASRCGLTPQYEGLEALYRKHKEKGLRILAFPANNFGRQEPGTNDQIKQFCKSKYDVSFDLFAKISVKGDDQAPLYKYLTNHSDKAIAGEVKWNFQKYLIGRDGQVIAKFAPQTKPDDQKLTSTIEKALAAKRPEQKPGAETSAKDTEKS
jgi:glutathione peroxidase